MNYMKQHATEDQFHRAYPRVAEWFNLKQRLDPENRFRNKLWDKYYHPTMAAVSSVAQPSVVTPSAEDIKKNSAH